MCILKFIIRKVKQPAEWHLGSAGEIHEPVQKFQGATFIELCCSFMRYLGTLIKYTLMLAFIECRHFHSESVFLRTPLYIDRGLRCGVFGQKAKFFENYLIDA